MIPRAACHGCHDDFYNRSDSRCWSAEKGTMMTRYQIYYMTAPTQKGAYTKVRKASCYRQVNGSVFHNTLPNFVKASDLNRANCPASQRQGKAER
jgi:hypothetical protein